MSVAAITDPSGVIQAQAASMGIPITDPNIAAAIASVQQAAIAEGLDPSTVEATQRVSMLLQNFQGVYQKLGPGVANATQTALGAARQFVSQNRELSGAVDTANGLVAAAQAATSGSSTPQDVAANFSGPLIALMIGTGAMTAGLGAAIVAGLAIADTLLDDLGVFPNKPGFEVCPGFKVQNKPDFAINCMAVYDPLSTQAGGIAPKSRYWRSFPEPTNPVDAWWFAYPTNSSPTSYSWNGATWQFPKTALSDSAIDETFPEWWMAHFPLDLSTGTVQALGLTPKNISDEQAQALRDFTGAFFQAWKANKEYWLNGRRGASDVQVLLRVAEIWNRSHQPGQGIDISPGAQTYNMAGGPPISYAPYWMTLINAIGAQGDVDILAANGTSLHLNTGFLKPVPGRITATTARAREHLAAQAAATAAHIKAAIKTTPPAVHPIHLAIGNPAALAELAKGAPVGPPKPSLWQRVQPWAPLGVGAATFLLAGPVAPLLVGAAGTAVWLEGRHKGWKPHLPKLLKLHLPKMPKLHLPKLP